MSTTATIGDPLVAAVATTQQSFEQDPSCAAATFTAVARRTGQVSSAVRVGRHTLEVDEPKDLGDDSAPTPVEYALAGLLSCQLVTYRVWAVKLGIDLQDVELSVDGDIDLRGFFGVDERTRPGFGHVRVTAHLTGPETPQRYAELQQAVDAHCPVLDLLRNPTPVSTTVVVN